MQTVPMVAGGAIPRLFFRLRVWRTAAGSMAAFLVFVSVAAGSAFGWSFDSECDGFCGTVGHASWYGHELAHRLTASGVPYDPMGMTGAHRTLPLGSRVRVTNLHNGRSVTVTINDRGPYCGHRDIDLSYGAARALDMVQRGIARVIIEPVES